MFLIAVVRIYAGEVAAVLRNKNLLYPGVKCVTVIRPGNRSMNCQGQTQHLNPVICLRHCSVILAMKVGFASVHAHTHVHRKGWIFDVCIHIYTYYIAS